MKDSASRITAHVEGALARALTSMTGKEFNVKAEASPDIDDFENPIVWQQCLSFSGEPVLWISAGQDLWTAAGQLTLSAVGIDTVTDEDCRSTWQEIVSQGIGGICTHLTTDVQHEITATKGDEADDEPRGLQWTVFTASHSEGGVWKLKAGWTKALTGLYEHPEPEPKPQTGRDSTFSKTFDLLLDVALPVSVSFGRTSLQIREVLKLNTGSIVELNRFVAEPVEVIVNDCVIARGEVVVVDGNYGVRITQLSSREDRLKFGMAESSARVGAPLR